MSSLEQKIPCPNMPSLTQILPTEPLLLMGAGPVPVPAAVAQAGSLVINHLGDSMDMVVRHVKEMARYTFQTTDDKILSTITGYDCKIRRVLKDGLEAICQEVEYNQKHPVLDNGEKK